MKFFDLEMGNTLSRMNGPFEPRDPHCNMQVWSNPTECKEREKGIYRTNSQNPCTQPK